MTTLGKEDLPPRKEPFAYADSLAGGLIHEVKNPLNTLSLNLQLLAEDYADPQTQQERRAQKRIQLLLSETQRLNGILDEFLNFIRAHRLNRAPRDINKLTEEVLTFVKPQMLSSGIELRSYFTPLPLIPVDTGLIKQALLNLLLNAEQAMSGGAAREIIVRTSEEKGFARIDVIDTGKGIPVANLEKIFEAFYSTRKDGTGLGLPTARRIAEVHGGRLTAHSEAGRGSCFTILLPIRAESRGGSDAAARDQHSGENA